MAVAEAGGYENFERLTEHLAASVLEKKLGLGVDERYPAVFVCDDDREWRGVDDESEVFEFRGALRHDLRPVCNDRDSNPPSPGPGRRVVADRLFYGFDRKG
jgi:hypothetical protein